MITTNISKLSREGLTFLIALALVFTLFAGQARAQDPDTTPPSVDAFSPADNGTAQPTDNVTVTFSELMDASSVNTAFTLTKNGETTPVAATITPDTGTGTSFTLNPTGDLEQGAVYTARVGTEATDVAGNALDADPTTEGNQAKVWSFEVADVEDPTVTLDSPGPNTEARNSLRASATATDNVGVERVEFIVDGTTRVQAVLSGGSYSAEIDTSTFAHGSAHTVAVQAFDAGGNASAISPSPARSFTIDRQVNLTLAGGPAAGGFTNDPAPLAFTTDDDVAAADRECRAVRAGATPPPFADCTSPYDPNPTQDGAYTYEVRVTDNVGNTDTKERAFTLDRTGPTVTIDTGPNGGTFGPNSTQTWTFTRSDATSGVDAVECRVAAQGADPAYEDCGATNSYSATNRPDGTHTFSVRVTDRAGNQSTQTRTFSIDATPPTVSLTAPADGLKVRNSVDVAASTGGGAVRVEFLIDGNEVQADTVSPYEASLDTSALADGPHTVAARAVDAFGNDATTASRNIVVDHQVSPPNIVDGPAEGGLTNAASVPLTFTVDNDVPAAGIECRAVRAGTTPVPAFAGCSSPYSPNLTQDGAYRYDVRVTDDVGNTNSVSRSFTLDRTDPALTIGTGPTNGQIFAGNTTQTWNFTAGDAHLGPVQCSVVAQGAAPVYGDCTTGTSHTASNLTGGSHTFSIRARDNAGNETVLSRSFSIDAQAPSLSIDGPANGQKVGRTVSVNASASDAPAGVASVAFLVNGTVRETDTAAPFAADLDLGTLAHGSNPTILVRATDTVGNRAEISRTVNLDLQVSSPTLGASPTAGGFTNAPSVPLTFDTDPDVAQRECRVNRPGAPAGTFAPCTSPFEPNLTQDGSYTYDVRVTDDVGNQTTVSRSFTLDRTDPTLALTGGPDGGTLGPRPATPYSWTFQAADTTSGLDRVECRVVKLESTPPVPDFGPCSAARAHTFTPPAGGAYEDGNYKFSVRVTDRATNQALVETAGIRIDATNPTATLTAPATGTKVGKTVNITFNATDDATAAPRVEFLVDGVVRAPVPGSRTPTSAALDMQIYDQDSSHTVAVRATDGVGNQSALSEASITVDKQVSPPVLGDTPAGGSQTNAASVPISFTTDADVPAAGQECQVELNGTVLTPFATCVSPFSPNLTQDGRYTYRVRVTDDVGNPASAQRTFTLDRTAPTLTVNGPDDSVFGPNTTQTWTLSAGDATAGVAGIECSVIRTGTQEQPAFSRCSNSYSVSNRPEGSYELRVRARDGAGNTTAVTRRFAIDATPPAVTIHAGLTNGAFTNQTSLSWSFSAEAGASFQCRVYAAGSTPPAFGPCSGNGQHAVGSLAQGRHTFEVRGLDALGNRLDGPSASRTVTVDTTAPRISGVAPAVNARNVAPAANVTVTFTENMRLTTLGRTNFKLIRSGTSIPVAARVTFSPVTNRATLNPVNPLQRGATYRVVVTTGARDLANNPLLAGKSWNFKVK